MSKTEMAIILKNLMEESVSKAQEYATKIRNADLKEKQILAAGYMCGYIEAKASIMLPRNAEQAGENRSSSYLH